MNDDDCRRLEQEMVTLRDHLLALMAERNGRLDERWQAQQEAIGKAEQALQDTLVGFPEMYARKADVDRLREDLNQMRLDHVQRVEIDRVRDDLHVLREAESRRSSQYLERELFDTTVSQWMVWRSSVDQTLAQQAGRGIGVDNLSNLVFRTIPIVIAIISTTAAIYFAVKK